MQPIGKPISFALCSDTQVTPLGMVHLSQSAQEDVRSAQRALVDSVERTLFVPATTVSSPLEFHYQRGEDWLEFQERPKTGHVDVSPRELELALSAVGRGVATIVAKEETLFSLFERAS